MTGFFPNSRLRRNRRTSWSRNVMRENHITPHDLIWPIFIQEGKNEKSDIDGLPDVQRLSIDLAVDAVKQAKDMGIPAVALFPYTPQEKRTDYGDEALNKNNLVNTALREIKDKTDGVGIITDIALDPYTSHGQDGLVENGYVVNDPTVGMLTQQAVLQAQNGADIVAPSDMMDGRVGAIRAALDQAGFTHVQIMSYSAKYASSFYGPFRSAVGSNPVGDKKTYQMDPANSGEALNEIAQDIMEGADSIIIKPGMPYLDIIRLARENFNVPVYAYQVSGEYAMIKAASQNGWLDHNKAMTESLISFKRAGAHGIWTYFAPQIADLLM